MRSLKWLLLAVVLLAIGGGVFWWMSVPHSGPEQLAYAQKLEKQLRVEALTKPFTEIEGEFKRVVEEYERVESKWGKAPVGAQAWGRIADLQETIAKDRVKAVGAFDHVIAEYPAEETAGPAMLEEARILRAMAEELKANKPEEAGKQYKLALDKLEEYRKKFPAGKKVEAALMETGRIWQDGIGEPLIHAIDTFEKELKEYPAGEFRPEALFRLGQLMEQAKQNERALAYYGELLERFPDNKPWGEKAQFARGKMLADKMDQPKEAAEDFRQLQEKFPDSPLKGEAQSAEHSARQQEAQKQSEEYGKGRYGRMPADTLLDKALPPSALFQKFAQQKLDAESYDLSVKFVPAEHRMTVTGSLRLTNRGDEKKELLFMFAPGLEVSQAEFDGKTAKTEHLGETLVVTPPEVMKAGAGATITFTYSGQFADPVSAELPEIPMPKMLPRRSPAMERDAKLTRSVQLALGKAGYALSGSSWYPVTVLGDVFTARMNFTITSTTPGLEVVANGAMETRDTAGGHFVFETKRPVFGLYFVYGRYQVADKMVGKIHYYTYLHESNAGKSDAYIETASSILSFYADRFGAFPYEKMALIEAPLPPFLGGVGPASLMILHEGMVAQKDVPSFLLAHELAHQWFGNLIPINLMDPGYSQWLSEGFATYADALYTEKTQGPEALAHHIERYDQLYFQATLAALRSAVKPIRDCVPMTALYRPIVYEKGAIVLHALRKVMGDEKFFVLLKKYVETYQDKPSVVDDFRKLASDVMGQDLSWFFAQWLDQTLYAHWTISNVTVTAGSGGQGVVMTVKQPDDLVKSPVDITAMDGAGHRQVIENIMLDKFEQKVEFTVPFKPTKIILDENNWVLKTMKPDNVWTDGSVEKPVVKP